MLNLTPAKRADLDVAGDNIASLGLDCSISFDPDFFGQPRFQFTAKVPGTKEYICRGADTLGNAAMEFVRAANERAAELAVIDERIDRNQPWRHL